MDASPDLTAEERRVIGCLIEKAMTTPDAYPLTLNSLVTACNQTTSRDPVVDYDTATVKTTLDHLRGRHRFVRVELPTHGSRAEKFKHVLAERMELSPPELAVLAVLMLRGPQTVNEILTRTERLHAFDSVAALERTLDRLADPTREADPSELPARSDAGQLRSATPGWGPDEDRPEGFRRPWKGPLVLRLERLPGQKEPRVAELLGGPVDVDALATRSSAPRVERGGNDRMEALSAEVTSLREELAALRSQFDEFRAQFG